MGNKVDGERGGRVCSEFISHQKKKKEADGQGRRQLTEIQKRHVRGERNAGKVHGFC